MFFYLYLAMKKTSENRAAFTLIELLVVIAIIGLLSTISIISLNQARSKARDSRRIADMHQLVSAIEMYYNQSGNYPSISSTSGADSSSDGTFIHELVDADLISNDMEDPWNDRSDFYYYYFDNRWTWWNSFCPSSFKYGVFFSLESNLDLSGFAKTTSSQNVDNRGYRRAICFF